MQPRLRSLFLYFIVTAVLATPMVAAQARTSPLRVDGSDAIVSRSLKTSGGPFTEDWSRARLENVAPAEMPEVSAPETSGLGSLSGLAPTVSGGSEAPEVRAPAKLRSGQRLASLQEYQSFEITDPTVAPYRTAGRIIARAPSGAWSCSGTVVTSQNESLVMTAAHCLYDFDKREWATRVDFMPAYKNQVAPLGTWVGTDFAVLSDYLSGGNPEYDIGAFRVAPLNGATIQDVTGSRGYLFNEVGTQFQAFGYPAAVEDGFTGEKLWSCISQPGQRLSVGSGPDLLSMGCDMTEGSSGGGWIVNNDKVNSVVSVGIQGFPEMIFGPYFGTAAQSLWSTVGGGGTIPDPDPTDPVEHPLKLTLKLSGRLIASGKMTALDGYLPCTRSAPVGIAKKTASGWKLVGDGLTAQDGTYRIRVPNKRGRYAALSPEGSVDELNLCDYVQSPIRRY